MSTDEELVEKVNVIMLERAKKTLEVSKKDAQNLQIKYEVLREALDYFMAEICYDTSHPTLLSLACEAVGGSPDATVDVGAAIVLLAGAADIHDDIIDQSVIKQSKPTVYGKYGKDLAIIAADILWIKGVQKLNEACEQFSSEKKRLILGLVEQAFFDLGSAEAKEVHMRGNINLDPTEYLENIPEKVAVGTASAQIGAIIGNGTAQQIEVLREYGKTLAVLMTIREDFINMFEPEELTNRFKNECLPLPVLYAFQDTALKQKIIELLKQETIPENELEKMCELIYDSPGVRELSKYMQSLFKETIDNLQKVKGNQEDFMTLLKFSLQGLPV
jgi:geranylgeranyl pyrophosphate synthase